MKYWNFYRLLFILFLIAPAFFISCTGEESDREKDYIAIALHVSGYLVSQQDDEGAIADCKDENIANEDSTMEYALLGLAAAYRHTGDTRYLEGFTKGIHWLAAREEMKDPQWKGSWFYAFSANPPYEPVPISPGGNVRNVRGVDATGSLFVYLLYIHKTMTGSSQLINQYQNHAKAALDFVINRNKAPNGYFYSSWQQFNDDPHWYLYKFQYTADQADVFLGMKAGCILFGNEAYCNIANYLQACVPADFFDTGEERYCLGLDENGDKDMEMEEFDGIFPQGYLPWVWGSGNENTAAYAWLKSGEMSDGSICCYTGDPRYTLSGAILGLAASSLGEPYPGNVFDWIIDTTYDPTDGGVRDTADPLSEKYSNVAGFVIMTFLGFQPFIEF